MKNSIFLLLVFSSLNVWAQKMPIDYFQEGESFYREGKNEEALDAFVYIVENHPKNALYEKAFYNIGLIHIFQNKEEEAIKVFETILNSNFNEKDDLGGSLMADPFTNFKHRSSKILSEIYYDNERFEESLHYLALSDTLYPYFHFCGNAYEEHNVYYALTYSDIYQKLNQPDKAIEKLLPIVFNELTDITDVIEELQILLPKKKNLSKKLDAALEKIHSEEIHEEEYSHTRYYFKFLNSEIDVPYYFDLDDEKFNLDEGIAELKETEFYKMVKKLY